MTSFIQVLSDSFVLLKNCPKLFVPKIFVAILYSVAMVFVAGIASQAIAIASAPNMGAAQLQELQEITGKALWLAVYAFAVLVVDVLVNASYSAMVADYFSEKKVFLLKAFGFALKKFFVIVPAVVSSILIYLAVTVPFLFLLVLAVISKDFLLSGILLVVVLAIVFAAVVAFYMLYPVAMLEKRNFLDSLVRSIKLVKKNPLNVSKAAMLNFLFSLAGFALAFFVESPGFFVLFALDRAIVVVISTYLIVLNPVFYLEFEKSKTLRNL